MAESKENPIKEVFEVKFIKETLARLIEKIPEEFGERNDLIIGFNTDGEKTPIFWCFNQWSEALILQRFLGEDQPLFAARSLAGFVENQDKHKFRNTLSELYLSELRTIYRNGPIVLGGNCQSAPIVESMANKVLRQKLYEPVLVTLEFQPLLEYPHKLLMLFGKHSRGFNPLIKDSSIVDDWRRKFPKASWGEVDGSHNKYFLKPAVIELSQFLRLAALAATKNELMPQGYLEC